MKIEFAASARKLQGKGASRRLRNEGRVPGVLYGGDTPAQSIELDHKELFQHMRKEAFHASILTMNLDGAREQVLLRDTQELPSQPSITTALGSVALVYDQSLYGATAPILGQRYRLELSPTVGDLTYMGVLADFRRYVIPLRPFTIAGRLMHFGRYGGDSDSEIIQPVNLGYPGMLRGYDYNSFEAQDCGASLGAPDPCSLYSRLTGSRMFMGSIELRFPLLGALGVGGGYYGFLPIELAVFSDAGVAYWGRDLGYTGPDDRVWFLGGDRRPLISAGAGLRIKLLGFAIMELDYAYAFQRERWIWQFGFVPGF